MGRGGGRYRRGKGRVVVTWMRERTTWYGYVAQSAVSFDAPDMSVYAVLDCTWNDFCVSLHCGVSNAQRTSLSSCKVHSRPSLANRRLLRSNPQLFIFSYAINCSAPLLTPTSASVVPR